MLNFFFYQLVANFIGALSGAGQVKPNAMSLNKLMSLSDYCFFKMESMSRGADVEEYMRVCNSHSWAIIFYGFITTSDPFWDAVIW